jgi:cytochrome c
MAGLRMSGCRGGWLAAAVIVIAGGVCAVAGPARAENAANGAELFDSYCSDCHTTKEGGISRKGPNLFAIVGRKTAAIPGFEYSEANRNAAWVWTPELLDRYLAAPKAVIPGTIMKFKGDPDPAERADIVAFLKTLHK